MRRTSTEKYLTLGMALTGDKKTMERRVRGVFGRKSSARAARILALALCIALGLGCFTTACQPAQETQSQPSAIPLETEEQAASGETAETTQNPGCAGVSFLSGLTVIRLERHSRMTKDTKCSSLERGTGAICTIAGIRALWRIRTMT